jgi:hypothetical protein
MRKTKLISLLIETSGGPYEISNSNPMEEIYIYKDSDDYPCFDVTFRTSREAIDFLKDKYKINKVSPIL